MRGSEILGCGMAVPDRRVTNADLERTLDTDDAWIVQRTGIRSRHVVAPGQATADLAVEAGRTALASAGLGPGDLSQIIVATCTPDHPIPGSAPLVQHALGAGLAGAFDVNAVCSGFVVALGLASSMVVTGAAEHVLVCGADVMSSVTDATDRRTAILFGDGAGAVVVGPSAEHRLGPFHSRTDGSRVPDLLVPAGGSRLAADSDTVSGNAHTVRMRGQDVYKHAVDRMTEAALTVLDGEDVDAIDLVVPHQANGRIVTAVGERLGVLPDRVVCNVASYGNTSAASIPLALAEAEADGRLKPDMRVLLVAFGAGFTWAGGLVRWGRS